MNKEIETREAGPVEVIGAGLGRTGTSSFKKAIEILGFGPCYHIDEVIRNERGVQWSHFSDEPDNLALLHSLLGGAGFRSSCDAPSCRYWKQQLTLYPEAKVILTIRDPESWYQSCCDTIFQRHPTHPSASIGTLAAFWMGLPTPGFAEMLFKIVDTNMYGQDWSKSNVLKSFNAHNENVIKTCPSDKLLVFNVSQGWEPLCAFLKVPVPDEPFPHINDTKEFQKIVRSAATTGYVAILLAASVSVLAGGALLLMCGQYAL